MKHVVVLIVAMAAAQSQDTNWVWLFNGQDLSGWSGDDRIWGVRKGTDAQDNDEMEIYQKRGTINGNTFLILDAEPEDYILEWEAINYDYNSGMQFRSWLKSTDPTLYQLCGPQADIGQNWSGKFWAECFNLLSDRSAACHADANSKVGKWSHFRLEVLGNMYNYTVNNIKCIEDFNHTNAAQRRTPGKIGIQYHVPGSRSELKGIKMLVLKGTVPDGISYDPRNPPVAGCTDPAADNQNTNANLEDNSCTYTGCADPTALNYFCTSNAAAFPCVDSNGYTSSDITGENCNVGVVIRSLGSNLSYQTGKASLTISTLNSVQDFELSIYDVMGNLVAGKSGFGKSEISFQLKNGIYFLNTKINGITQGVTRINLF